MKVKLLNNTPLWVIANAIRYSHDNHHLSDSFPITNDVTKCTCEFCGSKNVFLDKDKFICCNDCGMGIRSSLHIGKKDFDLIKRVGFKYKHESVLEFGYLIFSIQGVSRALLQELARHRLINLTVKSTRYTLKELKKEKPFTSDLITLMRDEEFEEDEKKLSKIFYDEPFVKRARKYLVFTGNPLVDASSIIELEIIRRLIKNGKSNDIAKYALPESYKTSFQFGINLRSLINFLELRTSGDALWEIRELSINILNELKNKDKLYFELLMENEKIKNNYINFNGS